MTVWILSDKFLFEASLYVAFQDIICCINAPEMQGHGGHQYKLLSTDYDRSKSLLTKFLSSEV